MPDTAAQLLRRLVALAAAASVLGGCGGGTTSATPTAAPVPSGPVAVLTEMPNMPGCGKPPSPDPAQPPPGAIMPPTARITSVRDQPPLVQLNGYVEMTPPEVRAWVESQSGLQIQQGEDEGYESEVLASDGEYTTFIKAVAVCATASLLAEVIAPASATDSLPTPAGGTPTPTPAP